MFICGYSFSAHKPERNLDDKNLINVYSLLNLPVGGDSDMAFTTLVASSPTKQIISIVINLIRILVFMSTNSLNQNQFYEITPSILKTQTSVSSTFSRLSYKVNPHWKWFHWLGLVQLHSLQPLVWSRLQLFQTDHY